MARRFSNGSIRYGTWEPEASGHCGHAERDRGSAKGRCGAGWPWLVLAEGPWFWHFFMAELGHSLYSLIVTTRTIILVRFPEAMSNISPSIGIMRVQNQPIIYHTFLKRDILAIFHGTWRIPPLYCIQMIGLPYIVSDKGRW